MLGTVIRVMLMCNGQRRGRIVANTRHHRCIGTLCLYGCQNIESIGQTVNIGGHPGNLDWDVLGRIQITK